jgi:hypothetical protein
MEITERPLDVSREAIERLLEHGFAQQTEARRCGFNHAVSYHDGFIRALQIVLEMEHQ